MATLSDITANGSLVVQSPPLAALTSPEMDGSLAADCWPQGHLDAARSVGRDWVRAHGCLSKETRRPSGRLQPRMRRGVVPVVGRCIRRPCGSERTIRDLFGLEAEALPDGRRWLDHGRWGVRHPGPATRRLAHAGYSFLPAKGEACTRSRSDRCMPGSSSPAISASLPRGETVVRLEERLGYVHKGVEGLMAGADLERAARLAGRVSGDSTVAYAVAFARAVEAACGVEAPPRAHWLRA
jgi:hypothetical protein